MINNFFIVSSFRSSKIWLGLLVTYSLFCGIANAAWLGEKGLNGKRVVLVHGFQISDLSNPPSQEQYLERCPMSYEIRSLASYCIGWPSHLTFSELKPLLAEHATNLKNQLGDQEIVFITHSSGDLIKEYILKYQKGWLASKGLSELNIAMSIDFAGASGGTELANHAVYFDNDWLTALVFGSTNKGLGFVNELTTYRASSLTNSSSRYSSIPRLRVISSGKENWFTDYFINMGLLVGDADDLVPLHSQCGSKATKKTSSCSQMIAMSGQTGYQSNGMSNKNRRNNFYPWLGSRIATHSSILSDRKLTNNELVKFGTIPFNDSLSENSETSGYWIWKKEYKFVSNTNNSSISELLSKLR